jgi:hypothetical protein
MSAAILRKKVPGNFTQVPNETIRDPRLSFKAVGVLVHILSLKNGSQISAQILSEAHRDGRAAILTALRELTAAGYYRASRERTEAGTFCMVVTVSATPQPEADSPESDKPASENQPPVVEPESENPTSDKPTPEKPESDIPTPKDKNNPKDLTPPNPPRGGEDVIDQAFEAAKQRMTRKQVRDTNWVLMRRRCETWLEDYELPVDTLTEAVLAGRLPRNAACMKRQKPEEAA